MLSVVGQPAPLYYTEPASAENCLIVRVALQPATATPEEGYALRIAAVPAAAGGSCGRQSVDLELISPPPVLRGSDACVVRFRFRARAVGRKRAQAAAAARDSGGASDASPTFRVALSCVGRSAGAEESVVAEVLTAPIEVRVKKRPSARVFSGFARPRKRLRSPSERLLHPVAAAEAYRDLRGKPVARTMLGVPLLGFVLDLPADAHGNPRERVCVEEVDTRSSADAPFRCAYLDGPQSGTSAWESADDLRSATVVGRVVAWHTRRQDIVGYTLELPADGDGNPAEVVRVIEFCTPRAARDAPAYKCLYQTGPNAGSALWELAAEFKYGLVFYYRYILNEFR